MAKGPWLLAIALSVAAHGMLIRALERAGSPPPRCRSGLGLVAQASRRALLTSPIDELRRARIARARRELSSGTFELGAFLLDANVIDGIEAGDESAIDDDPARALYARRLAAVKAELSARPPPGAVRASFADLRYAGVGGTLRSLLETKAGSCEPLSHLIGAALFDAGAGDRVTLRAYGGDGGEHLTVVWAGDDRAVDLVTGAAPEPGGASFPAQQLVEVYALAHGLPGHVDASIAPDAPRAGKAPVEAPRRSLDPRGGMARGYPKNDSAYSGSVPLFGGPAVVLHKLPSASPPRAPKQRIAVLLPCSFVPPIAWLEPWSASAVGLDGMDKWVDVERTPEETDLEQRSEDIDVALKQASDTDRPPLERVAARACAAALYQRMAVELSIVGYHAVASRSAKLGAEANAMAGGELKRLSPEQIDGTLAIPEWPFLYLEGGRQFLEARATDPARGEAGNALVLGSLIAYPPTRERGIELAEAATSVVQGLTLEWLTRPGASFRPGPRFELLSTERETSSFVRAHRALVAALRLADVHRATDGLDRFWREARRQDLADAVRDRLVSLIMLAAIEAAPTEASGLVVGAELDTWAKGHGYPEDNGLRQMLRWALGSLGKRRD